MEVTKLTNELLVNNLGIILFKHVYWQFTRPKFINRGNFGRIVNH
jgi:hypothetical protein